MNAHSRWAALLRVLRWQIASRLMEGPIAFPFVEQTKLFATRGMAGATGNWYCGFHEVNEMAFVLHLLRPDEHFVDIGANIGSYTILAGGGARARVTAVEPISATFECLKRNVLLNALDERVSCYQIGLSDQAGKLRFSTELDTVNHVLAVNEDLPSVEVPVMRLDDLVGADTPTLIKIDVEGHERSVLEGGACTLENPDLLAVIMETNGSGSRYGVSDDVLSALMRQYGFSPFAYDPFRRRLLESACAVGNTIFVRKPSEVEIRTKAARRFRVAEMEL